MKSQISNITFKCMTLFSLILFNPNWLIYASKINKIQPVHKKLMSKILEDNASRKKAEIIEKAKKFQKDNKNRL